MKQTQQAIDLLSQLIEIPSFSKEEDRTADLLEAYLYSRGHDVSRIGNNVLSRIPRNDGFPTILLNSHHDTVKPVSGWKTDPFKARVTDGKLFGLGSNDAGASLVSLLHVFLILSEAQEELPYNLVFLASAEEEISGDRGIEYVIPHLPKVDLAIVGEPTGMRAAVAEKGLVVLDCYAKGKSGHAARDEGINALYQALEDIDKLRKLKFSKKSDLLGNVKLTVTQIEAGTQHNVVPDHCHFVVDVRTNENYRNEDVVNELQSVLVSKVEPRSLRLNSSHLPGSHTAWTALKQLDIETYGSPTMSDQALMPFPSLKMGPGESARSHTAGEYILLEEIEKGIEGYLSFLQTIRF